MTDQPELIPVRPIERELSLQFKIAYDLGAKVQRLEAEIAELRKDRERLEWICSGNAVGVSVIPGHFVAGQQLFTSPPDLVEYWLGETPREAIDAAIAAAAQKETP